MEELEDTILNIELIKRKLQTNATELVLLEIELRKMYDRKELIEGYFNGTK